MLKYEFHMPCLNAEKNISVKSGLEYYQLYYHGDQRPNKNKMKHIFHITIQIFYSTDAMHVAPIN